MADFGDPRLPLAFWAKVEVQDDGCWHWTAYRDRDGYGTIRLSGRKWFAHRAAYHFLVEPMPADKVSDHQCRVHRCVNPAHIEPVTRRVNNERGVGVGVANAAKVECIHGHPFTPENTYVRPDGARTCRTCNREAQARRR